MWLAVLLQGGPRPTGAVLRSRRGRQAQTQVILQERNFSDDRTASPLGRGSLLQPMRVSSVNPLRAGQSQLLQEDRIGINIKKFFLMEVE